MKIAEILYGEKGLGKTTYALRTWPLHLFIRGADPLNNLKSTMVLELALQDIYYQQYNNIMQIVTDLRKAAQDDYAFIIDNTEQIDTTMLEVILNSVRAVPSTQLIFIFDIPCQKIYQSKVFRLLIEWNVVSVEQTQHDFQPSLGSLREKIKLDLPDAGEQLIADLIDTANYNFNHLKQLIWLVTNRDSSCDYLAVNIMSEFFNMLVDEKLSELPKDLLVILKKSSVIGNTFQRYVLEAPQGFNISGVKAYLSNLEEMNMFIQSYLKTDDTYQFVSEEIYNGVLECLDTQEKIAWEKLLMQYYLEKSQYEGDANIVLTYLHQLKRLAKSLNDYKILFWTHKQMLFIYEQITDLPNISAVLNELIDYCKDTLYDYGICQFLAFHKVDIDIKLGFFDSALSTLKAIESLCANSLYWQYYCAKCLYATGNIDQSADIVKSLVKKLKYTSTKANKNQPIYSQVYSLQATIQHHLGEGDYGNRYYVLAINHAKNIVGHEKNYYDVLKKCDMYFEYPISKSYMLKCISFYETNGLHFEAAEIYTNLFTELMFQEKNSYDEVSPYVLRAIKTYENTPNERFSYVKNNEAIFYMLYEKGVDKAIETLIEALLVGLSDFTYMTIYLNLTMLYLLQSGSNNKLFLSSYENFMKYYCKIKNRKCTTQYEDVYKQLLDVLILEHNGSLETLKDELLKLSLYETPSFFKPIIANIKQRNSINSERIIKETENQNYYYMMDKLKIFLAEFRFWE